MRLTALDSQDILSPVLLMLSSYDIFQEPIMYLKHSSVQEFEMVTKQAVLYFCRMQYQTINLKLIVNPLISTINNSKNKLHQCIPN